MRQIAIEEIAGVRDNPKMGTQEKYARLRTAQRQVDSFRARENASERFAPLRFARAVIRSVREDFDKEFKQYQKDVLALIKAEEAVASGKYYDQHGKERYDAEQARLAKERLRLWDINDEQIKKIETTGKPIRTLTIYSPASGYILQKMAVQGMRVMPGEKLFDIVDLSSVWIVADIYEYELPLIKVGQQARIGLSYFPGKEFTSPVDYIYPSLASETRTAKVRFTIPNPDGALKPQMFTNVEIKINLGNRLTVPSEAVIDTGVRQIVYVDKGEGYFEPREVMIGLKVDGIVEVTGGITAGEKIASSANFLIDSEAQLKGVSALPRGRKK